jgi:hypothetical protein
MQNPKRPTERQRKTQVAFARLLQDPAEADRIYNHELPESMGGRIISTDISRFLDKRYRNTPEGRPRDLLPGWDLAWRYAQDRFKREISNRGGRTLVRFMAGGWGAGKTHALKHAKLPDLAWDGTLKDTPWARRMIDLALTNRWHIEVAYVFRDIELALYGAFERALEEGRSVPIEELPTNHAEVQRSILRLILRYREEPRLSFVLFHNLGARRLRGKSLTLQPGDLAHGGPLHYTARYEDYYGKAARQIQALNPASG